MSTMLWTHTLLYFLLSLAWWSSAVFGDPDPGRRRGGGGGGRFGSAGIKRRGKAFSLFNVVQFENGPCCSSMSLSGSSSNRNGTCYTASECEDKGGTSSGNCAAGFGVCCVFVLKPSICSTCSNGFITTVNQNCSYIQNPSFPSADTGEATYNYLINKCDNDVCFIRLDFETFTLKGTGETTELDGGACDTDQFVVGTLSGANIPTICGSNAGQHMYIDIGQDDADQAGISISLTGTGNRQWDIKVSQIECSNAVVPPAGCLQYSVGLTGRFTTFNFLDTTDNHLGAQEYSFCIRPEAGFGCIQYQVCGNVASAFSLQNWDTAAGAAATALQDNSCATDYIAISGSSQTCSKGVNLAVDSRYCGQFFSNFPGAVAHAPVCDCTPPFIIDVVTDFIPDQGFGAGNNIPSRGVCLDYTQIPC